MKEYIEVINKWLLKSIFGSITGKIIKMTYIDIRELMGYNLPKSGYFVLTGSLTHVQFARYVLLIIV